MYGKVHASMFKGSMLGTGAITFAVMTYAITEMRPPGFIVELNPKLLSAILGEKEADVAKTIEFLCSPDPDSRSKKLEGRRLNRVGAFAYEVVNGAEYNAIKNQEDRNAYMAGYMRDRRAAKKPAAPKNEKDESPVEGMREFTDGWMARFEKRFKAKYVFNGAKDGTAAKALLQQSSASELLALIDKAWQQTTDKTHWNCINQTRTLATFRSSINSVRSELAQNNGHSHSTMGPPDDPMPDENDAKAMDAWVRRNCG